MSYSIDRASLLADQIERIATLNAYQLVGQRDNLEFWLEEIVQALAVLDGYPARFRKLNEAQVEWVRAHDVKVSSFCPICGGGCEFGPQTPDPPRRIPSGEIEEARRALREAGRRFLRRLYRAHMVRREDMLGAADRIGTGFEPNEFEREEPPDSA